MSRHSRTKLVPTDPDPKKNQVLETVEESNQLEQIQDPVLPELDNEMECSALLWIHGATIKL
jgi:hypothetical protein